MATKHKEAHNAAIDIRAKSPRWGQEEVRILARTEAEAPERVKFINKYLLERFEGRTLAGIVGQRRTAAYKKMVGWVQANRDDGAHSPMLR